LQYPLLVIHGCAIPRPAVTIALQRVFGLSPVEASLLLGLLKHDYVNKSAIHGMAGETVDVHICRMRQRLKPAKVAIETIWGVGSRISPVGRQRALDMILQATP
jgi:DNA-binding response OmpR family regulator